MISGFGWAALAILCRLSRAVLLGQRPGGRGCRRAGLAVRARHGARPPGSHRVSRGLRARLLRAASLARPAHAAQGRPALDRGESACCLALIGIFSRASARWWPLPRRCRWASPGASAWWRRDRRSGFRRALPVQPQPDLCRTARPCWRASHSRFLPSRRSLRQSCSSGRPSHRFGRKRLPCVQPRSDYDRYAASVPALDRLPRKGQ